MTDSEETKQSKGPTLGIRHLQILLIFLNIVAIYVGRLNAPVAVVAMTSSESTNPDFPGYEWTLMQRSYILSSFYWGYVLTQYLGGYLSRRFGSKIIIFIAVVCSGIFSVITPLCIPWGGWQVFCVIRVIQGLAQGLIFPCIYEHIAKWSPAEERNRLGALAHTGIECGTVLAMFSSGMIAASSIGWPGIFYVSGGICLFVALLWFYLAANNAPESRFISEAERIYIESSLKRSEDFHKKKIPIPWRAIFTSIPFYALLIARCAEAWGLTTVQAEMPTYMKGVLELDIKDNAIFSALPYLCMWALSYIYVLVADVVLKKELLTLTHLRRVINSIAFCVPAAALVGIGFLDAEQKSIAILLLTIAIGTNSGATIGSSLNTIDLSPNHAGMLMGVVNTIANFIPILTPLVAGAIVSDEEDRSLWQIVFLIAAGIFFFGNLIYIIWGTAEVQPWNAEDYLEIKDIENKAVYQISPKNSTLFGIDNPEKVQTEDNLDNNKLKENLE